MKRAFQSALVVFAAVTLWASAALAATVYAGETISRKKVISSLDLADLPAGKHSVYFQREAGLRVLRPCRGA